MDVHKPVQVQVVAALLCRAGRILVQQRPPHKLQPLAWEFPGGKIEPGEAPQAALIRECEEELGTAIEVGAQAWDVTHDYPELTVRLRLFWARLRPGAAEPRAMHAARLAWCMPTEMLGLDFLAADGPVVRALVDGSLRHV